MDQNVSNHPVTHLSITHAYPSSPHHSRIHNLSISPQPWPHFHNQVIHIPSDQFTLASNIQPIQCSIHHTLAQTVAEQPAPHLPITYDRQTSAYRRSTQTGTPSQNHTTFTQVDQFSLHNNNPQPLLRHAQGNIAQWPGNQPLLANHQTLTYLPMPGRNDTLPFETGVNLEQGTREGARTGRKAIRGTKRKGASSSESLGETDIGGKRGNEKQASGSDSIQSEGVGALKRRLTKVTKEGKQKHAMTRQQSTTGSGDCPKTATQNQ